MKKELKIIKKQSYKLLTDKDRIIEEINNHKIARGIIVAGSLICAISIIQKPEDIDEEIRMFQELDKLQGIIKL